MRPAASVVLLALALAPAGALAAGELRPLAGGYSFTLSFPSFSLMKARISSDMPSSLIHCSL